jgi:hypothetical protein
MNTRKLVLFLVIAGLLASTAIFAQTFKEDESVITNSSNFITFLRATTMDMSKALEQARKSQDSKKTNCIAPRLVDLRRILGDSEVVYKSLREAAFDKKPAKIREEYVKVRKNKDVAEQLIKLVNECYGKINEPGGFTETVEQFLGLDIDALPIGYGGYQREDMPEPRPPIYEPEPTSASEE